MSRDKERTGASMKTDLSESDVVASLERLWKLKVEGAINNRASLSYNKGDYDHALADLNEAIRLDPKNAVAFTNRGRVYNDIGNYDRAIADWTSRSATQRPPPLAWG